MLQVELLNFSFHPRWQTRKHGTSARENDVLVELGPQLYENYFNQVVEYVNEKRNQKQFIALDQRWETFLLLKARFIFGSNKGGSIR